MRADENMRERSLAGVWVVNTRSPRQAPELDVLLETRGAHVVPYPCIDIAPARDLGVLDAALKRAVEGAYGWLVFTSANAVEAVEARLGALGIPVGGLARTRIATVGARTAEVVADRMGIEADLYPREHLAETLASELVGRGARSVLVPQAEQAREALVRILVDNGVDVEAVTAYRTVVGSGGANVPGLLKDHRVDAVVFASPSAVDNMATRLEQENGDWEDLRRICVACIGPVTAAAAERRGLEVHVLAKSHTLLDLVEGLESHFQGKSIKEGGNK